MKYSIIGFAIAGAVTTAGCGDHLCNGLYPSSGLVIDVENTPGPGTYQLHADADGEQLQAVYSVDADARVTCVDQCRATAGNFKLALEFDSDVSSTQQLRFAIHRLDVWDLGPDHLGLRVMHEQAVVFDQQFPVTYSTSEPNGEGCGEVALATVHAPLAP